MTSAVSYGAIVILRPSAPRGVRRNYNDSTQKTIASILVHPAGGWLTVIIGLVAIGVGLGQFLEAYRATFRRT